MRTVRAMPAAYKQGWMPQPETFTAQVQHDAQSGIISIDLPSGAVVGLPAEQLRAFLNDIERRKGGK